MFIKILCSALMVAATALPTFAAGLDSLPVQDAGRVKPFDTFAREALQLVWGKEKYKGRPATHVVMSWMLVPDEWDSAEFILVRHSGLREALKLDNKRLYYSPKELMANERISLLMQELANKRDAREKLDPFYQAVQNLENQIQTYHAVRVGAAPRVAPRPEGDTWFAIMELPDPYKEKFADITRGFAAVAGAVNSGDKTQINAAEKTMDTAVAAFIDTAKQQAGPDYAPFGKVNAEVHYNHFHPFMYAWICYLLAAILFGTALIGRREKVEKWAWVALIAAFLLHTYGFGLRVYIAGRPPVSNMYESVVWVAWGSVMISMILNKIFRLRYLLFASTSVATLCLILCDLSSHVLDGSINPLEPVLRDHFWLIVHVLTITLSYAAFFLAFVLGDLVLVLTLKDEKGNKDTISGATMGIYRAMQVGVVLLAAGTILGGVWADYSWGRFWGWDPKETWAFIALLGYLVILHGRIAGWFRQYGLAAAAVVAFSLVIMAWYGVNFVLGAGLHTYGFGAGGVEYVAAFVVAHLLFVAFVTTVRQNRLKSS